MEDMESSHSASHCVVCCTSIRFIADRTSGSPSPSDLKLANAFVQCLTLDPAYAEDLTNSSPFCLRCKLSLEQWDFCQNQILLLGRRSRQLKASLIAKLLESPGQPIPDTSSKLDLIRRSIKRRFDPKVVLEKIDSMSNSNENQKKKPKRFQVQEDHTLTADCGNFVQVKLEELNDERITEDLELESSTLHLDEDPLESQEEQQSSTEGTPKDDENSELQHTVLNGRHTHESCQKFFEGKYPWRDLVAHIKQCHRIHVPQVNSQVNEPQGIINNSVECSRINLEDRTQEGAKQIKKTPTFYSHLIREVKPGQYVYRDKIPFHYEDEHYTCGHCDAVISAENRQTMREHLRFCEKRTIPLKRPSAQSSEPTRQSQEAAESIKATHTFYTNHIQEVKRGEYLYRDKISFVYKDKGFTCGSCKRHVRGNLLTMRRHLIKCEKTVVTASHPGGMPTFKTDLIKEVKPGEYLYRDKISFVYKDKGFTCGHCKLTIRGSSWNMAKHLSCCEKKEFFEIPPSGTPTFNTDLIKEVTPGEYLYRDKISFHHEGGHMFRCGHCKLTIRGSPSNMEKHFSCCEKKEFLEIPPSGTPTFNTDLIKEVKPGEYLYSDKISFYHEGGHMFRCGHCKLTVRGGPWNMEKHLSYCEKKDFLKISPSWSPTFNTDLIKQVKPGQYMFRDKIPFYYKDQHFTCGRCYTKIKGGDRDRSCWTLKQHLSRCESRGSPLKVLPSRRVTCAEELTAQAGVGRPYLFQCFGAPVALKDDVFYCEVCHDTFETFQDIKEHILATPGHTAQSAIIEPSVVDSQVHVQRSGFLGFPVMVVLPSGQQQPNVTGCNSSSTEPEAAIVKTEDAGLIIPDIVDDDEFTDLERRVDDSGNEGMDPSQLLKIDFDCLEEEMHEGVTEELLGS